MTVYLGWLTHLSAAASNVRSPGGLPEIKNA